MPSDDQTLVWAAPESRSRDIVAVSFNYLRAGVDSWRLDDPGQLTTQLETIFSSSVV